MDANNTKANAPIGIQKIHVKNNIGRENNHIKMATNVIQKTSILLFQCRFYILN